MKLKHIQMLIYKKYIVKNILHPLLALTLILTSLVWITQILKLLPLIDQGIGFINFLKLAVLFLPSLIFMISPIISVITVLYVYVKLQNNRQLIILKTGGLNNYQLAKPALLIATIVTIICYFISLHLLPLSYNKLKHSLSDFRENYASSIINERTFNQLSKHITIYVDKKNPDGTLEGIVLFDNKTSEDNSVLFAKSGSILIHDDIPIFHLQDGFRQTLDDNKKITNLHFDDLLVEIKSDSGKNDRNKTSLELYVHELLWPDENLSESKKLRFKIDGHQRLLWPFFNYCLVFVGISVFLNIPYSRKPKLIKMIYVLIPLFIVTYCHFSLQKIAYQKPYYIFGCYLNIFLCIIFSIWQTNQRKI